MEEVGAMTEPPSDKDLELLEFRVGPGGTRPGDWLPRLVREIRHLRAENARLKILRRANAEAGEILNEAAIKSVDAES